MRGVRLGWAGGGEGSASSTRCSHGAARHDSKRWTAQRCARSDCSVELAPQVHTPGERDRGPHKSRCSSRRSAVVRAAETPASRAPRCGEAGVCRCPPRAVRAARRIGLATLRSRRRGPQRRLAAMAAHWRQRAARWPLSPTTCAAACAAQTFRAPQMSRATWTSAQGSPRRWNSEASCRHESHSSQAHMPWTRARPVLPSHRLRCPPDLRRHRQRNWRSSP